MRAFRLSTGKACKPLLTALLFLCFGTARAQTAPKDSGQLRPGETTRQGIAGGETHLYRVPLAPGRYLRAVVMQEGIDLSVSIFEPGTEPAATVTKAPIIYMDSPNGSRGPESVSLVAAVAGEYLLAVRSEDKGAMQGRYEVRLEPAREPTEADLRRVAAEAATLEGRRLRRARTAESGKKAVAKYSEALASWRSLGDRYGEAYTLYALGLTYYRTPGQLDPARSNLAAALDHMTQALGVFSEMNDLFGKALIENDMGAAVRDLDSPSRALPHYDRAYKLYEAAGDQLGMAQVENNKGYAYALRGDHRAALAHYQRSLPILQAARDRNMEAIAYNNIAGALEKLGDPTQALAKYRQALSIWEETGSERLPSAYNNVAAVSHGFGEMQAALDYYGRALSLFREGKNVAGAANTLNNIGMAYADMGEATRALEYFKEALPLWQGIGQKRGQAATFDNTGYALYLLGRHDEALGNYQRARDLYAEVEDTEGQSFVLTHMGMLYAATGQVPRAIDSYERAKEIQQGGGLKLGLAVTLDKMAGAYASAGDVERAAAAFGEALKLWVDLGEERGRAASLYGLARVESGRNNLTAARDLVGQAVKIVESLRAKTANHLLRTALLASKHDYYELDVDVKMRLAEESPSSAALVEAAFESNEHARARGLIDLLTEGSVDVRAGVSPELAAEEGEIQKRLGAVSDRLLLLRGWRARDVVRVANEIEALKKEFDTLSTRHEEVLAAIRSRAPRYAELTQPAPPKASRLREMLDPDTVLLEYSLGDERSYLWVVTRARVEGHRLRGRREIERAADRFREVVASYGVLKPGEDPVKYTERRGEYRRLYRPLAEELGQLTLSPVAGRVGSKRLVVVADGVLQSIPFEALFVPGGMGEAARHPADKDDTPQPLGITNEVVYLPSASVLALLRTRPRMRPASKNIAVFADPVFNVDDNRVAAVNRRPVPDAHAAAGQAALNSALRDVDGNAGDVRLERLRYTSEEADAIASVAPVGSALKAVGFRASRTNATSPSVRGYRIVHFATHALVNDRRPELSGLVMSLVDERGRPQDGFLRLGDIYNLDLPADLVTLSACKTGVGREVRGEGLISLTRGFMYAGASRVVASLWKVDDEATAELMKNFYRHMLKDGLPPAQALRLAKSEVRQARAAWAAPYFWAGFVLQGDWLPPHADQARPKRNSSPGTH